MSADYGKSLAEELVPFQLEAAAIGHDPGYSQPQGLSIRPLRDEVHVRQLPPNHKAEGGIVLIQSQEYLGRVEVLAVGPDVYGFDVGDIVRVEGYKSGIAVSDGTRIISQEICVAVEESLEQ